MADHVRTRMPAGTPGGTPTWRAALRVADPAHPDGPLAAELSTVFAATEDPLRAWAVRVLPQRRLPRRFGPAASLYVAIQRGHVWRDGDTDYFAPDWSRPEQAVDAVLDGDAVVWRHLVAWELTAP